MSAAYKIESQAASDPFVASRDMFDALVASVSSRAAASQRPRGEVEAALLTAGRGLLNQLFQDHLDLRSLHERRVEVADENGTRMSERRAATRKLPTRLGPVMGRRFLYQPPAPAGRAPADAGLRLSDDGFLHGRSPRSRTALRRRRLRARGVENLGAADGHARRPTASRGVGAALRGGRRAVLPPSRRRARSR